MYLYGASEIVASDFRPKLPARTINIISLTVLTVELKCFRQATRSIDTIASIHRAWPSGIETCTFSLIPKRPRPKVGVVVWVRDYARI